MTEPDRSTRPGPAARRLGRREFLTLGVGAFVVSGVPRLLHARPRTARRTEPVMGTLAEIVAVHDDERTARTALDAAFAELWRVDRLMSRFRADSDVGRANARAAASPVAVGDETSAVLGAALAWAQASDGMFDPCVGRAVALWDVGHRRRPPAREETRRYAGRRLYRAVELERRDGTAIVAFHDPDAAIDLGGIAKGYAVDRAVAALRAHGVRNGLVNAGGDLFALGRAADGEPWRIGIRSPERPDALIGTVALTDRAVATSGDYEQFFEYGGRRYHHLLDPRTGEPRRGAAHSVSIAAATCMDADAAGTAVFGMRRETARRLLAAAAPGADIVYHVTATGGRS